LIYLANYNSVKISSKLAYTYYKTLFFGDIKTVLNTAATISTDIAADPLAGKTEIDILHAIQNCYSLIQQTGAGYESTYENAIIPYIPFYNNILSVLNTKATLLPPSGAIAGIYASVDNDRGVWKAPANVSINSVNGLSEFINDAIQENMNIDPNAGKSINALRSFTGKGIIVWAHALLRVTTMNGVMFQFVVSLTSLKKAAKNLQAGLFSNPTMQTHGRKFADKLIIS